MLTVKPDTSAKNETGRITIKADSIYYKDVPIGIFKKKVIDKELISIVIYNMSRARVAEVTYVTGAENWTIATPVDQNKMYLKYSEQDALEGLFSFLVDKKYL